MIPAPGVVEPVLGVAGPESVYCDWFAWDLVQLATSVITTCYCAIWCQ